MLHNIFSFLLQIAAGLLVGLCLLRLYMQYHRVPLSARSGNPIGPLIFALTDWLVLPLRRVMPAVGRWDTASLVAAILIELVQYALLWLISGGQGSPAFVVLLALFGVVRLALSGLSVLVIVYAALMALSPVLSPYWMNESVAMKMAEKSWPTIERTLSFIRLLDPASLPWERGPHDPGDGAGIAEPVI